jgi:hypothetical protein
MIGGKGKREILRDLHFVATGSSFGTRRRSNIRVLDVTLGCSQFLANILPHKIRQTRSKR